MITSEAALLLGVKPDAVRRAIQRGTLKAKKIGRDYWIEQSDLDAYAANHSGKPGRRTKK